MAVNTQEAGSFFYVLQDSLRILFVDDDPILREFAVVNLSTESATIETAPDGAAALDAMEAAAPDIVLLDLEMPNVDGFEVLRRARANPSLRGLPIIVVTGREDVDAVDEAFRLGATSFVVKPLNWRLLSHQLRYVHRSAMAERTLSQQCADADTRLRQLGGEAVRFLTQALALKPDLRPAAAAFARAADTALGAATPAAEADADATPQDGAARAA